MLVPMKKATLIFLKEDKEEMLKSLQRGAHIMLTAPEDDQESETPQLDQTIADTKQSEAMLRLLNNYSKKPSFFAAKPSVSYTEFESDNAEGKRLLDSIEEVSQELTAHQTAIAALEGENAMLRPWTGIGNPLNELKSTKYVVVQPGFIQPETVTEVENYILTNGQDIQVLEEAPEGVAAVVYLYKKEAENCLAELRELGFSETQFPKTDRPPLEVIRANNQKIDLERAEVSKCKEKLGSFGSDREQLELYIQQEVSKKRRQEAPYTSTLETVMIQGWVRSDRIREFKRNIREVTDIYELDITDPPEGETPPTVTKNNYFLAQFETITDSFSLPKSGTLDPAPIAGPWYWIIYGMMMGDAGYGLVMAVALFIFRKIKKPEGNFGKLVNVLYYSSYTTIFWGIIFGSYFGETFHPLLFNPLDAPMYMLIFSMIVGVFQLFSGMILKMVLDAKEGHFMDGVYDQLSWMVLITGLGFMFLEPLRTIGMGMAILGAAVIFLTAGREKPTIVGKFIGGLLGLYDITSYLSDILSYSRILALGLATSVVGMVMNMMAGMLATNIIGYVFAAIIFVVGHVFNIALSMLSAYVHDSRLQYIEFFNKFYDGGGIPFTPIEIDQRYVNVLGADLSQGSNAVKGDLQ